MAHASWLPGFDRVRCQGFPIGAAVNSPHGQSGANARWCSRSSANSGAATLALLAVGALRRNSLPGRNRQNCPVALLAFQAARGVFGRPAARLAAIGWRFSLCTPPCTKAGVNQWNFVYVSVNW